MIKNKINYDLTCCINKTYMNQNRLKKYEEILNDTNKKERLELQECRLCYYTPSIGGQAFTTSFCGLCGKEMQFYSTNVDLLCIECAKLKKVCKHCSADINDKLRKKL